MDRPLSNGYHVLAPILQDNDSDDGAHAAEAVEPPPHRQGFFSFWFRRRTADQPNRKGNSTTTPTATMTDRSIWRHRHARSAEEGIRRERTASPSKNPTSVPATATSSTTRQLSSVLAKASGSIEKTSRRVAARTLTGLITAMAEEVEDLDVEVDARDETPYSNKHVTAVRIKFSRLGFKPLRMGGRDSYEERHHAVSKNKQFDKFQLGDGKSRLLDQKLVGFSSWNDDDYCLNEGDDDNGLDQIDADEAFDRIDVDNSGFLDRNELIEALRLAAIASYDKTLALEDIECASHTPILEELASDLFELYDINGDGVVDRREYKNMVEDMAALRKAQALRERQQEEAFKNEERAKQNLENKQSWMASAIGFVQNKTGFLSTSWEFIQNKTGFLVSNVDFVQNESGFITSGVDYVRNNSGFLVTGMNFVQNNTSFLSSSMEFVQNNTGFLASGMDFVHDSFTRSSELAGLPVAGNKSAALLNFLQSNKSTGDIHAQDELVHVFESPEAVESFSKSLGSITFSDIKMDLRRLFFGAIPILKHIVPGGPLILEPFTTTITGSFDRHDIMNSYLLDAGLRRLVMRALRRRVGFLRDFLEGAMFKGRSWKTYGDDGDQKVEIPELTNVEFDENEKLIITGRARVQTSPESPVIDQSFKVRTSIGTRKNGRFLRLDEPELALVIECPEIWEKSIESVCDAFNIEKPPRPKPLYTFFPIYSPFKLQDDDGFDLGEDNSVTSLYIKDGALRFEMSAVLRPGRFLGSHYIAFSIPIRTFIVTLDRVVEGIRSARKVKKAARALKQAAERRFNKQEVKQMRRFNFDRAEDALLTLQEDRMKNAAVGKRLKMKSFFNRFIDGYLQAERDEAKKERLTTAIQDFFGRQGG